MPRALVAAAGVLGVVAWVVLSPTDLGKRVADSACVPKPTGLTHWWPGEGSAIDIVGGDHGTIAGSVDYADGMVGRSFRFGRGYLRLSGAYGGLSAREISVVAWMQTQRSDGFQAIFSATTSSFVHLQTTSLGGSALYTDPIHTYEIPALTAEPTGIWRHVALTAKTGDIRIYENAVATARIAGAFSSITKPDGALLIGAGYELERPFQGLLDEIQVYDRALADHEIQSLFRAGKAGICAAQPG